MTAAPSPIPSPTAPPTPRPELPPLSEEVELLLPVVVVSLSGAEPVSRELPVVWVPLAVEVVKMSDDSVLVVRPEVVVVVSKPHFIGVAVVYQTSGPASKTNSSWLQQVTLVLCVRSLWAGMPPLLQHQVLSSGHFQTRLSATCVSHHG